MASPWDDLTRELLSAAARPAGLEWLEHAEREAAAQPARVPVLLPQLPRRIGRTWLAARRLERDGAQIDSGAWRACDAAALRLLTAGGPEPDPELLEDLYTHGDSEERSMVLRCMQVLPVTRATGRLLGEVQRTNQVNHVAAGTLDSNLLARTLEQGDPATCGFGPVEFARTILKLAFLDLPLERMFAAPRHATEELSRMLQALATEREAAGRKVWFGTNEILGHAPTAGSVARLIGGLETGIDEHRLGAVRGVAALVAHAGLDPAPLRPFVTERLPRENHPVIRAELQRFLGDGATG